MSTNTLLKVARQCGPQLKCMARTYSNASSTTAPNRNYLKIAVPTFIGSSLIGYGLASKLQEDGTLKTIACNFLFNNNTNTLANNNYLQQPNIPTPILLSGSDSDSESGESKKCPVEGCGRKLAHFHCSTCGRPTDSDDNTDFPCIRCRVKFFDEFANKRNKSNAAANRQSKSCPPKANQNPSCDNRRSSISSNHSRSSPNSRNNETSSVCEPSNVERSPSHQSPVDSRRRLSEARRFSRNNYSDAPAQAPQANLNSPNSYRSRRISSSDDVAILELDNPCDSNETSPPEKEPTVTISVNGAVKFTYK